MMSDISQILEYIVVYSVLPILIMTDILLHLSYSLCFRFTRSTSFLEFKATWYKAKHTPMKHTAFISCSIGKKWHISPCVCLSTKSINCSLSNVGTPAVTSLVLIHRHPSGHTYSHTHKLTHARADARTRLLTHAQTHARIVIHSRERKKFIKQNKQIAWTENIKKQTKNNHQKTEKGVLYLK